MRAQRVTSPPFLALVLCGGLFAACASTKNDRTSQSASIGAASKPLTPAQRAEHAFLALSKRIEREQKTASTDWAKAEASYLALTTKYPKLGVAWFNLGVIQERLGKDALASSAYRKVMSLDPTLSVARENLAALVLRQGDKRQAITILREVVALDPGASVARLALGRSLLAAGRVDEAIALSQAALAADPKNLGGYCIQALAAVQSKEFQRVRLLKNQALKIDQGPSSACIHHAMGLVLRAEGETASALLAFNNAVLKDPKSNLEAWFHIAEISMEFKNFKRAVESYQTVCSLAPRNLEAFLNLGVALKGLGRFKEAESAYMQAIELAGKNPLAVAHFNLGVLYLRNLDDMKRAKQNFNTYIRLARPPQNAPVFNWLLEIDQRSSMSSGRR